MSENDILALKANFNRWVQSSGAKLKAEPFLFYTVDQFLKPFHLSASDVLYGLTDGANDGGIDGFYFFVNSELIREDTDIEDRVAEKVHLCIFQVKNAEEGFKPTEIDKLVDATDEILNLSSSISGTKYHKQLVGLLSSFKEKYRIVSGSLPPVFIQYFYITKADEAIPNTLADASIAKVKEAAIKHLSKAEVSFNCINAQSLLEELQKRPEHSKTIEWKAIAKEPTGSGYFGLVCLTEYFKFMTDSQQQLKRSYFDSNVRGFWKTSPQNKRITASLESSTFDFWQLNNGITILSPNIGTQGFDRLVIHDPQIVNGLQTSRCIFNYFSSNPDKLATDQRQILIRVIETKEKAHQNAIIFATNNQNRMPASALRATDDIQLKIEDVFEQWGLFYDRRKGFHKDQGRPINDIVSIEELSQAVVSIVLQRPKEARGRPGDYVKVDERYQEAFSETHDLNMFRKCITIQRKVDDFLEGKYDKGDIRNIQFYVSSYLACECAQHACPSPHQVAQIDENAVTNEIMSSVVEKVWDEYVKLGQSDQVAKGPELQKNLQARLKRRFNRRKKRDLQKTK